MAKRKSTAETIGGLPGHFKIGPSMIQVPISSALTTDPRNTFKYSDDYWITLWSQESQVQLLLKWARHPLTDSDKHEPVGGTLTLPAPVVSRIFAIRDRLTHQSRRVGALKATQTRKDMGIVPFRKKMQP